MTESEDQAAAVAGIVRTEEFFHSAGMRTRLADYGIAPADAAARISDRFRSRGVKLGERQAIDAEVATRILMA